MREFITLIFFRSRGGKARSLKIPKKVLNVFLIASLIIIFLSVFSTFMMVRLYGNNRILRDEVNTLIAKKDALGKRLLALQDKSSTENGAPGKGEAKVEEKGADAVKREAGGSKVVLENIKIIKANNREGFKIKFDVVKKETNEGNKINGSLVVVAKVGNDFYTSPKGIEVKDGFPIDYSKGDKFVITSRKTFERKVPYAIDSIEALNIIVYDNKGELLLKQKVELE